MLRGMKVAELGGNTEVSLLVADVTPLTNSPTLAHIGENSKWRPFIGPGSVE
jgi:hypothetical protein